MQQAVEFLGEVLRNRRVYLVVDGIDECLQPSEVLEAILELPTVIDGSTRVFVSSRMRPDAFDPDGLYPVIRLTPQTGNYSTDLRIFVEDEMAKIEGFHRRSERFNEAVSKVVAASDGNFQWASALLTDLKLAQAQGRFWETITTIPKEIQILVKQSLWGIWQKPESKRRLMLEALEWTIFCMEPLTVGSFPFGRVFDSDGSFLDYEHRRIDRSRFFLRFGTEFLMFPTLDGKFELFHHRLADYILLTSMEENPQFQLTDGPTRLALSCVRYLSSPSFQESLNSETYQHTGLHSSQPDGARNYLRSKYRCLGYASKYLVQHLLKVSDVTTDDGSELVSTLITFFLSTNAVTWVEAAQVFDPGFPRYFLNNCPELIAWITSVFAVHPRWRDSLHAVPTRLDSLKYHVCSFGGGAAAQPPMRPRASTYESPSIHISSYPDEYISPSGESSRARSRSPRGIGGLFTSFTGSTRHENATRSPQRRTREEVERGVERRSPARSTFPISNHENRHSLNGTVSNALAIANASATGAVPLQYHYLDIGGGDPANSWGQPPANAYASQQNQFGGSSRHSNGGPPPSGEQPYPMQEYYGPSFQQDQSYSEPPPPYMR
ncbi:hypothetical protein DRE_02597 [Drechslerella stenobrocha 248]|uniref:NACHT domain-containing protein n=1 Tax=Drechslerella stenobrocha 248 TaxID=1043628 RepID=W7I6X4_9PEZI|nr:hypothetical protein DRE_02597 [Drechslerella stenobrocha 248]